MATRFAAARALAQKLILRNGVSATLRRTTEGSPTDAAKPWRSGTVTTTDYTAPMVFLPTGFNDSYIEDGRTHQAEIKILVAADDLTVTPNLKDKVIRGTDSWSVVSVKEINPNDEQVLFILFGVR